MANLYTPPTPLRTQWSPIPDILPTSIAHAVKAIRPMRAILMQARAVIVCIGVSRGYGGRRFFKAITWIAENGGWLIADAPPVSHDLIEEAGAALSDLASDLARRWPDMARPKSFGFASDGSRILFNAAHPSCAGSQWMHAHLTGRDPATCIVDMKVPGVFDTLCPR